MIELSPSERATLRARAHALRPVVSVGQHGLTPSVVHEIDVALAAQELVKVRVHGDDRDAREALLTEICEALEAAPVQHLGKVLIVYRPKPEAPATKRPARAKRAPKEAGKSLRKPSHSVARGKRRGSSAVAGTRAASKSATTRAASKKSATTSGGDALPTLRRRRRTS